MSTTVTARRNGVVSANGSHPAEVPGHGPDAGGDGAELDAVLTAVRHNALALCAQAERPPIRLRVATGDIIVELTWAEAGDEPAGSGSRPGAESVGTSANSTSQLTVPAPRAMPGRAAQDRAAQDPAAQNRGATEAAAAAPGGGAGDPASGADERLSYVTAPSVGVFYHAPEPGARPFVRVGDMVTAGQQVAILEVMKLMIPIEAETGGRVTRLCLPDATSVEYGERLIAIDPLAGA